jgi:hypothetical protein
MKDTSIAEEIEYEDVKESTPAIVTYSFDSSFELFKENIKKVYTDPSGNFYEKVACQSVIDLSQAIGNNPKSILFLNNFDALNNFFEVIQKHPDIIQTLESVSLMNMFGVFMSRSDVKTPNGQINPMAIFNCAKEDFGLDIASKIPGGEYFLQMFLKDL